MCTEFSEYYSQCLPGEYDSPVDVDTHKPSLRPTINPTPKPYAPPVAEPTQPPVATPDPQVDGPKCGCASCTQEVLDTITNGFSCGSRINWVVSNTGSSETDACALVGGEEYPSICGSCDPNNCNNSNSSPTGAPVEPVSTPTNPTTSPPPPEGILLTTDKALNAWEVFLGLEELTHVNSQNPPNYALVAS